MTTGHQSHLLLLSAYEQRPSSLRGCLPEPPGDTNNFASHHTQLKHGVVLKQVLLEVLEPVRISCEHGPQFRLYTVSLKQAFTQLLANIHQ